MCVYGHPAHIPICPFTRFVYEVLVCVCVCVCVCVYVHICPSTRFSLGIDACHSVCVCHCVCVCVVGCSPSCPLTRFSRGTSLPFAPSVLLSLTVSLTVSVTAPLGGARALGPCLCVSVCGACPCVVPRVRCVRVCGVGGGPDHVSSTTSTYVNTHTHTHTNTHMKTVIAL